MDSIVVEELAVALERKSPRKEPLLKVAVLPVTHIPIGVSESELLCVSTRVDTHSLLVSGCKLSFT